MRGLFRYLSSSLEILASYPRPGLCNEDSLHRSSKNKITISIYSSSFGLSSTNSDIRVKWTLRGLSFSKYAYLYSQHPPFGIPRIMSTLLRIIYSQLFVSLTYPKVGFADRTCILTRANPGLGFEAAKHLVGMNAARVILAVRNRSWGEAAQQLIEDATGQRDVIEVWGLSNSSFVNVLVASTG